MTFVLVGIGARAWEVLHYTPVPGVSPVKFLNVLSYLDMFGMGMLVACVRPVTPGAGPGVGRLLRASGLIGLIAFAVVSSWSAAVGGLNWMGAGSDAYLILFPTLICLATALMLIPIVADRLGRGLAVRLLSGRVLKGLGVISYSVYLYHLVTLVAAMRFMPLGRLAGSPLQSIVWILVALPPTLLLSWIMFVLVERPSLQFIKRLRATPRALLQGAPG